MSAARQAASRSALGAGGLWQKKLMLNGLPVCAAIAWSSLRMPAASSIAHGSDPRPPALDTATASADSCTPAIGAWMIGNSVPSRSVSRMEEC